MKNKMPWLPYLLAAGVGLAVGYTDTQLKTDDALPSVLMVGLPALVFGLVLPRHSWRWGLLIGGGVPAVHLTRAALGYPPPYPIHPNVFASLIAIVPSVVFALVGGGVRFILTPPTDQTA